VGQAFTADRAASSDWARIGLVKRLMPTGFIRTFRMKKI
jgi:hypothetical protein